MSIQETQTEVTVVEEEIYDGEGNLVEKTKRTTTRTTTQPNHNYVARY